VILGRPFNAGNLLANLSINYEDVSGSVIWEVSLQIFMNAEPGSLFSDERVREADGYIVLSRALIDIGIKADRIYILQQEFQRLAYKQRRSEGNTEDDCPIPQDGSCVQKHTGRTGELPADC